VLRVRRPDQTTRGQWPWRVETTSSGPLTLAQLIADELEALGTSNRARGIRSRSREL
jgi:hypothetical protein